MPVVTRTAKTISASQTRIPTKTFNGVVYKGERIRVLRRGGDEVYIISAEDLRLLEQLEDQFDLLEAQEALAKHEKSGSKTVPLDDVVARSRG